LARQRSPFSILEHKLVPRHILLSKEEAEEVCRKFRVKPHQLPHIKSSDPVVKMLGAQPGDMLKVVRKSFSQAGDAIAYRYVVR
jgi:DNA-directed RNA polymerase subunit H